MKTKTVKIDKADKADITDLVKKALATAKRGNMRRRETEYVSPYFSGMTWNVTLRRIGKYTYGMSVWLMNLDLEEITYFTAHLFVKDGGVSYDAFFPSRGGAVAAIMSKLTK